jgi:carboxylesterase type B
MFQIHGGAFTGGQGSDPGLDGTGLASRGDVVVVTINYRLSTLGFLALNDGITNGNYGLGDQVTALDWVREYISSFGGDKDKITIFGQSAGAGSVRALLTSPKASGKFASAIMQSNLAGSAYASTYSDYYNISTEYSVAAQPILNATGCLNNNSRMDCLRGIDPFILVNMSTVARFVVQDGEYITEPRLQYTGNSTANVPVMIGFMRDDGASFITYPHSPSINNVSTELANSGFTTQQLSDSTLNLYPVMPPSSIFPNATTNLYNASSQVATDSEFRCLDLATAYSASIHDTFPNLYVYEFNRSYNGYDPNPPVCSAPPSSTFPLGDPNLEYFKCHSGELAYVFGNIAYNGGMDRDGLDTPFSQYVLDSWTAFARNGDPNPDSGFLQARGFVNSSEIYTRTGSWDKVTGGNVGVRLLQWEGGDRETYILGSKERCDAVGYSLDFFED